MADSKYDILFEPINIGPRTAPNRFMQPPQCAGLGTDEPGSQAGHRAMKAEGGYGIVFTEFTGITPDNACDPYRLPELWDEEDIKNVRVTTDAVHEHGALAGAQLGYFNFSGTPKSRQATFGVSQVNSDWIFNTPHGGAHRTVHKADIPAIRKMHVDAALRARDAGYDLITLHMGHGSTLLLRFLLPFYNNRTDEYGGSFENRARLARETFEDVREALGDDAALGTRFAVDTLAAPFGIGEGGMSKEEGHAFIEYFDDLVDYWDIITGGGAWGENAASSRTHSENFEGVYTSEVKQHTNKPVINIGRFTNPDTMVKVIKDGQCDIIGTSRPSIADPFIPTKIREGRLEDIRECIGCNICVSRYEQGSGTRIICTQNATTGEEYRRGWHPEKFTPAANRDRDVLVVGAGPAGMECAMVLGKRQMNRVHLVDADEDLGGSLKWISRLPGRGEWARVINYRKIQMDKLKNVEFIPKTRLDVQGVLDYGAEIVIIATGSSWDPTGTSYATQAPLPVAETAKDSLITPEQIMVDGVEPGKRVVIYDADNYYMGVGLAEKLAKDGHDVTLATPDSEVASYTEYTLEQPRILADMRELGVEMLTNTVVTETEPGGMKVTTGANEETRSLEFDSIVVVTQRWSDEALYQELRAQPEAMKESGIEALYRVGDCVAPTFIAEAIFDGHRLAREIDSPDPSTPLPFVRERGLASNVTEGATLVLGGATL